MFKLVHEIICKIALICGLMLVLSVEFLSGLADERQGHERQQPVQAAEVALQSSREQEPLHPSGEHLVAEAINEVFEEGVKEGTLPWKKPQVRNAPGESQALHDWHQANVEWIACLPSPKAWCDGGRSMKDYEQWQLEHPRPR